MNEVIFSKVLLESKKKKEFVSSFRHKRYLFSEIQNSSKDYYIGIYGLRGIGKTVLLLQMYSQLDDSQSIYFSADSTYLSLFSLYDILKFLVNKKYKNIFIDEITYKKNWVQDIKTIFDEKNNTNIYFTSSSSIDIQKGADLSRRVLLYELKPASLREYINIKYDKDIPLISFKDLIDYDRRKKLFLKYIIYYDFYEEYLKFGGFLYSKDNDLLSYYKSLENVFKKILYSDFNNLRNVDPKLESDILNIFYLISSSSPFELSYSNLTKSLNSVSKNTLISIINDLEKINLIKQLKPCSFGYALVRSEYKLFLSLPFRYFFNSLLNKVPNVGSLREDFFVSSLSPDCYVKTGKIKSADFMKDNFIFEIGGKNKKNNQKANFIVSDDLDVKENKIPLFLFGFLY
jgi:uncharacterized protein